MSASSDKSRSSNRPSLADRNRQHSSSQFSPWQEDKAQNSPGGWDSEFSLPSSEDGSYFAQETPPPLPELDELVAGAESQSKNRAHAVLKRYGIHGELPRSLTELDISSFSATLDDPPVWTAIYINLADKSVMLAGAGSDPIDIDSQRSSEAVNGIVRYLSSRRNDDSERDDGIDFVCSMSQQPQSEQGGATLLQDLSQDFQSCAGGPIMLSPGKEQSEDVVAGAVMAFCRSTTPAPQVELAVRKILREVRTILSLRLLNLRRDAAREQQRALVKLMRMTNERADGSPANSQAADNARAATTGHADVETSFFDFAASAIGNVLRADTVVILDVSGFQFEKVELMSSRSRSGLSTRYTQSEPKDGQTDPQGRDDRTKDFEHDKTAPTKEGSEAIKDGDHHQRAFGALDAHPHGRWQEFVCSYLFSDRPVPLLAATGDVAGHFSGLSGRVARPLIAKFLASVKAFGIVGPSHAEGGSTAMSVKSSAIAKSLLSDILPSDHTVLLTSPVVETSGQPCYLLVCGFKEEPAPFEEADLLFLEQMGATLLSSAIRIRSQAVDRAQVQLTQRMQHQLRTPLHTIIGFCESASDVLRDSPQSRSLISSITLSAESLDATLCDIFDYSALAGIKAPKGSVFNTRSRVSFRTLFSIVSRTAISAWRLHCLSKTWLQEEPSEVPPPPELLCSTKPGSWRDVNGIDQDFEFDCESLTRITSKAVTNALQATERGLVLVDLGLKPTSETAQKKGQVRPIHDLHLTVKDSGTGMHQEALHRFINKPFNDTGSGATDGMGLSLSICSALVARLGGRISVSSQRDEGTCFEFAFPCRGSAPPTIRPVKLTIATLPTCDRAVAKRAFVDFCQQVAIQFGAEYLGDARADRALLQRADVLLIAGETLDTDERVRETVQFIGAPDSRRSGQLLIELRNRAFGDPPQSLKTELKQVWLEDLPAVQIHRPFALPDLDVLGDVLVALEQRAEIFSETFLATRSSNAGNPPRSEEPANPQGSASEKGTGEKLIIDDQDQKEDAATRTATQEEARFRCLVVEDNPLNARILITLLRRAKIDYLEARDGIEAVDLFREWLPQVVLLDINMPRMNGFDAAVEMRKIDCPHYYPRIVAVTALSSESDKIRGFRAGIDDWMTKPVRLAQLAEDVKTWKTDSEQSALRDTAELRNSAEHRRNESIATAEEAGKNKSS
ncbi:unnamed protein product [Parajaminaea phylloscopi]